MKIIKNVIRCDIKANDQFIANQLRSSVSLINKITKYIIRSGGKRIRPNLLMIIARALGYKGEKHIKAATIIEFIHTATLLHDDVIDNSELRRGRKTSNNVFGNSAAILTGDFLYSRAFQIMMQLDQRSIIELLADTTNMIAEGEVLQLVNCHNVNITETEYFKIIYYKTSRLFETTSSIACIIANTSDNLKKSLSNYGKYLGNAFQIIDDILDYSADKKIIGKNIGDDLKEGRVTLPVIRAIKVLPKQKSELIKRALMEKEFSYTEEIIEMVNSCDAIKYCKRIAYREADKALECLNHLEESEYREALIEIVNTVVKRK